MHERRREKKTETEGERDAKNGKLRASRGSLLGATRTASSVPSPCGGCRYCCTDRQRGEERREQREEQMTEPKEEVENAGESEGRGVKKRSERHSRQRVKTIKRGTRQQWKSIRKEEEEEG